MYITNKLNRLIAAFILGASVLTGCVQKEDGGYDVVENAESAKQMVRFKFDLADIAAQTKSSYVTTATEGKVNNISVFIFDGSSLYYSGYAVTSGSITVPMDSGTTYDAYAFVNMGDLTSSITSLSQLQNYKYNITSTNLTGGLPMYGTTQIEVTASTREAAVPVKRLVGRYELRFSDENLSDGASITVRSVQVKNMASSVSPYMTDYVATGVVANGDYSSSSDIDDINGGDGVFYYVAENLQGVEPGIGAPKDKIPSYSFTSVNPDRATYLEVKCDYSKGGAEADVTYRLFLGENSTTDFNIRRNTSYIITLAPQNLNIDESWWKCEPDLSYDYIIKITPASQSVKAGHTASYTATREKYLFGEYQMGLDEDITDVAEWSVASGSTYAQSNGQGVFEGKGSADGTATVTASYDGDNAQTPASLSVIGIKSLVVSPSSANIETGKTQNLTATVTYNDNSTENVTSTASWTSSAPGKASVSGGVVTGVAAGSSTITASYGGVTASADVTVTAVLQSIELLLDPPTIMVGGRSYPTVIAHYDDGSVADVTSLANIASMNTSVARWWPTTGGYLDGKNYGESQIRAQYGGKTAYAYLNVTADVWLESLEIGFVPPIIEVGETSEVVVTAYWSDGDVTDVTNSADLSCMDSSIARLDGTTLTGRAEGNATVSATLDGKSVYGTLIVSNTPVTLTSISVDLDPSFIQVGGTSTVTVTALWSNGSTTDVTNSATISSGTTSVATLSGSTLTGKAVGTSTISASYDGKSGSATLTVSAVPVTLESVSVSLTPSSINIGGSSAVTVTAHYSDGHTENVTNSGATISSGTTSVATLSGSTLTGKSAGTSTISASFGGKSGSATLTVNAPTSVVLSLSANTIYVNGTSTATLMAHWPDGTATNVTSQASFSSSNTSVATKSGNVLTGKAVGYSTITGSYAGKIDSDRLDVIAAPVDDPTVEYIEVELAKDVIVVNNTTSATVWAHWSDGSVTDVTSSASMTTASSSIATISGSTVTGRGMGITEVRASYSGKSASASIKVIANISITSVSSGTVSAVYYDARNGSHTEGSITRTSAKITVRISGAGNDITSECLIRQTSGIGYMSIDSNGNVTSDYDPTMAIREPANSGSYKSSTADATFEFTYVDEAGVEHTTSTTITMTLVRDNGSTNYRN